MLYMAELSNLDMWSDDFKTKSIKTLLRQCSRWAVAAEQDESPLISLLHANYAAGYLWALKDIATEEEIKSVSSVDIQEFEKKITDVQDKSTKAVTAVCPDFIGNSDPYLLQLAGDM